MGGYVIELAKADGLRVIADAAPKDEALVRGLGADVVLPRGENYPRRVRAEAPGGVDGAVDTALLERRLLPAVRDGARIATLRRFEEEGERGVTFHPVVVSERAREADKLERLCRQAEESLLTLRVAEVLPVREAAEAHRRLEGGGVRGRLVLTSESRARGLRSSLRAPRKCVMPEHSGAAPQTPQCDTPAPPGTEARGAVSSPRLANPWLNTACCCSGTPLTLYGTRITSRAEERARRPSCRGCGQVSTTPSSPVPKEWVCLPNLPIRLTLLPPGPPRRAVPSSRRPPRSAES
ncbi:zinc-binding dehydrogenase [Streptomyces sp. NPDC060209]|uniref:zinc-binding dehydrogenase n=1 Tax=Streptomyces sp. NPDC060209 TaxID=3347073 RepID=UPI0036571DCB